MLNTSITSEQRKLIIVLSVFWGTLFGSLGIFFPYYSLYLKQELNLTGQQVGIAMGIFYLVGLISQPAWGYLADRTGARKIILIILSLGMVFGFVAFWYVEKYAILLIVSACFAAFYTSLIPQGMALGLSLLYRSNNSHFEFVRAFGSLGFLVTCFGFPYFLKIMARGSGDTELGLLFPCSAAIILITALSILFIPNQNEIREKAEPGSWKRLFSDGRFIRFFIYVFLANFMLDGPMFMFPIFVESVAPDDPIGTLKWLWLIMLVPEIMIIAMAGHIRRRIGVRLLMFTGLGAGGVKWVICGFWGENLTILHGAMFIHSFYVVGALVAMPLYVNYLIPSELRSTGQGLATMISSSLGGGICSNYAAGWLIDYVGPAAPQMYGGMGALVLLCVAPFFVPRVTSRKPEEL
tara:strand:- start:3070 stop:4293 length:1224 start_codon:yes stop_codon:yes gene_type:complete